MITETDLDFVLGTFEIPKKVSQKVRYIVRSELVEVGFPHFDFLYRRTAELVEAYTNGDYNERFMLRLDAPRSDGSRETLHSLIGSPQNISEENSEEEKPSMTIDEVVDVLSEKIDPELLLVLRNNILVNGKSPVFYSKPEELLASAKEIEARVQEVVRTFEKDGTLLIPRRPIIEIRWNPRFYVKFGKRNFNGNYLQFFRDNIDVYKGMKRKQLHDFDGSLYRLLLKHKQLNEAIPEHAWCGIGFPEEVVAKINNAYTLFDASAKRASKYVGIPVNTILRHWRKAGFEIRPAQKFSRDYHWLAMRGINFDNLGDKMAQRMLNRDLIQRDDFCIDHLDNIILKPGENLPYDIACDSFGILSYRELDRYVKDDSWLIKKAGNKHIDRLSALYLATISPTVGLKSVCSPLVALTVGLDLQKTEEILKSFVIPTTYNGGMYKTYDLRKKWFNPAFKQAIRMLEITS